MHPYTKTIINLILISLFANYAFADGKDDDDDYDRDKGDDDRKKDKYSCNLTIPNFNFPLVSPLSNSETRGIGSISVTCQSLKGNGASPVKYEVKFSSGFSSSFYNRSMRAVTNRNRLGYNLFADSALTQILGDGTSSTYTFRNQYVLKKGDPSRTDEFIIYGNIPSDSMASQGQYTDVISVWLDY